jgi:hypothetical protein
MWSSINVHNTCSTEKQKQWIIQTRGVHSSLERQLQCIIVHESHWSSQSFTTCNRNSGQWPELRHITGFLQQQKALEDVTQRTAFIYMFES